AIPGIVMGAALLTMYISFPIYGTIWVLLIAYATRFFPYGMRAASSSLVQLRRELEEAAEVSGAGWLTRFRFILLPLLRPGLLAACAERRRSLGCRTPRHQAFHATLRAIASQLRFKRLVHLRILVVVLHLVAAELDAHVRSVDSVLRLLVL